MESNSSSNKSPQEIYYEIMNGSNKTLLENQLVLSNEKLLEFLHEEIKLGNVKLVENLKELIYESRTNNSIGASLLSSNVISILISCNISFACADLSGIRIMDADLRDGVFVGCDFTNADLSRVDLCNAKLDKALFKKTILKDAIFNPYRKIELDWDKISTCCLSADNTTFLIGFRNGTMKLLDKTGNIIHKMEIKVNDPKTGEPLNLDDDLPTIAIFSPDEKTIISFTGGESHSDGTVKLWNRDTGCLIKSLCTGVKKAIFSRSRDSFLCECEDSTIQLWNIDKGLLVTHKHNAWSKCQAISHNGEKFLSCGSKEVKLWRSQDGEELQDFLECESDVKWAEFSPNSEKIVCACDDKKIRLWEINTRKPLQSFDMGCDLVSASFSHNGNLILGLSYEGFKIWNNENSILGNVSFIDCYSFYAGASFSLDDQQIIVPMVFNASGKITIRIWDKNKLKSLKKFDGHTKNVLSVAFSPLGNTFISVSVDQKLKVWNKEDGRLLHTNEETCSIQCVAFLANSTFAYGLADGTVKLWNLEKGLLNSFKYEYAIEKFVVSADSLTVLLASSYVVHLIDINDGKILKSIKSGAFSHVGFASDGDFLIFSDCISHCLIGKYNKDDGTPIKTLKLSYEAKTFAVSPERSNFIIGMKDKIDYYDLELNVLKSFECSNADSVMALTFSNDGKRFASGYFDGKIKVWDRASGNVLDTLVGHDHLINSLAFSPDGLSIASVSFDRTVKLWEKMKFFNEEAYVCKYTQSNKATSFSAKDLRITDAIGLEKEDEDFIKK